MITDEKRREMAERTRETEIGKDLVMPGDVYKYRCGNDQGYGYMVPVKTSRGWDFIDTYHLGIPSRRPGESGDAASIRQIIELGHGEHDGCVGSLTSMFYYCNAYFEKTIVPGNLHLAFNLNDCNVASYRECEDYDDGDVTYYVPLYREQHFSWNSGRTLGLCFVRKGAEKSPVNEFRSLLSEAFGSIVGPRAMAADYLFGKVEKKFHELEDLGLSTQGYEDDVSYLAKHIEIIKKCDKELREINRERMAQRRDSDNTGEERTLDDEDD